MKRGAIAAEFTDGVPTMGGARWIDLVNSRMVWNGEPVDFLASDEAFEAWIAALGDEADSDPDAERRELVALRQVLSASFDEIARSGQPTAPCLAHINRLLSRLAVRNKLVRHDGQLRLDQLRSYRGPRLATEIAEEFALMLASLERTRLKHCENPACDMVFHDHGRNNRRRWCSTTICGNRDKVARYRRRKAASTAPAE